VGAQPTAKQQARKRSKAIVVSKNDTLHRVCGLFVRFKAQRVYLVDDELRPQVAISPTDIIDCLATWLDEHDAAGTAINTDLP
jgi:ribosomal protein L14